MGLGDIALKKGEGWGGVLAARKLRLGFYAPGFLPRSAIEASADSKHRAPEL